MARYVLGPEHAGLRLDKVLTGLIPGASRGAVQRWIREGRVRLNAGQCRPRDPVQTGDVIDADPGPAETSAAEPDPSVALSVLFEDEHLIVVDKAAGLVVHPARGHWSGTLVNGLLARPGFRSAAADPQDPSGALRPGIVQRLDKDTSGVLVVAKTSDAREGLKEQLAGRQMEREYWAITLGDCASGRIETLHGRHPRSRVKFTSITDEGRNAITEVTREESLLEGLATLVRCRLETGRTHQIRVHLAEQRDAPLLADEVYGRRVRDPRLVEAEHAIGRQALHARVLGFVHPVTAEPLRFSAAIPDDFRRCLRVLGSQVELLD